jgi:hypothetical protein
VLSRALLFPGPLPPSSHLGLTLLRHVAGSGLRFALHQLGRPLLERVPVRLVRLRLYLDGDALAKSVGEDAAGRLLTDAVIDPGGIGGEPLPPGLHAAAAFHGLRLKLAPRRLPRVARLGAAPEWMELRAHLTRLLPATNDAFLAEVLAALDRRERRRRGEALPPVLSRAAQAARAGGRPPLSRFGPPDPHRPSWARALDREGGAREALAGDGPRPVDGRRGRFREVYRQALDLWTPGFLELARRALERGVLKQLDDAFFLPLETADDLESPLPMEWLAAAVAGNRREYAALLGAAEPGDLLERPEAVSGPPGPRPEWEWAPLLPLP